MPSAKQIAWRKKFARMSKAGVFRTTKKGKARAKETAEYLGNIRRVREADEKYAKSLKKSNPVWMDYIGDWKTSSPKKYPAYKKIHVAVSGDKNSYLELKFHTYNKDSTGKYFWHLMSLDGMKGLIRRFKLKKI